MGTENDLSIVVVEDEPELRDNLVIGLTSHGFSVCGVSDAASLYTLMAAQHVDVILLDLGLPGEDGIEVALRLKGKQEIGVIMVTARGMAEERLQGFESGADNYFVKPVNIAELAVAITNLGRRLVKRPDTAWQLNTAASTICTPNGISVSLTNQECSLLNLLMSKIGVNVTFPEIFLALGQPDDIYAKARLEVLVCRLRSKVQKAEMVSPLPIKARHSIGYIFLTG